MSDVIKSLLPIFRDIFDDDDLSISIFTSTQDIEGWDSLGHIRLVVAVEKFFEISFSADEINDAVNVGAMVDLILLKKSRIV